MAIVYSEGTPVATASGTARLDRESPSGVLRSVLARLLWEEDSPETRPRLSQLLYSISKREGGERLFEADPEILRPALPGGARDLVRFHELLQEGDLGPAVELVERGYLSKVTAIPGRSFEGWLEGERARIRTALRKAAAASWSRHSADESWRHAGHAAAAMLRLHPSDEAVLRNVLLAKGMAGEVHEALAEYAGFRDRVDPETGSWTPEPQTRELIDRLEGISASPVPPPDAPCGQPDPEPDLCGRDEELALLNRAISHPPPDSTLTTVVVTGEGGIGKTRLVEEAIRGARLRGFTVLRSGSSEFERDIPLNPLLEALHHPETGEIINGLEEPWHSVLLSLLPQFHRETGPLPEVPYVEPGNLPRRTYEAIRRLVASLTEERSILLFLDDFQWADETSVAAVEFLRRRWNGGRLVVVLALRQTGTGQRNRAEEFGDDLIGSEPSVHIALDELDDGAVDELIDSVAGRSLDTSERRRISLLGGRNPFFIVELTHEYVQGHLELQLTPGDPIPVPVSIRQLLERRLDELAPLAERILNVLAVLGSQCTVAELARLSDRTPADSATAMDQLQAARLVRWSDGGFALRHQLVRHTVYSRLQEATRRLLHEQIAEWLLEMENAGPGELALHFDRAGRSDQALRFALEAADAAEASGAVPEAVHLLTTARRNTSDPEKAAEIVGRLGHLHHLHRNFTEAAPLLDIAAERFRQQGRISEALAAEVEKIDALSRLELLPLQDFLQKARELKQEARQRGEWETLINLLDVEIHTLDREGKVDAVREVLKEAEELCDKGSPAAQCAARATLAIDAFYRDPANGLLHAHKAVEIARQGELEGKFLIAVNRLVLGLMAQGTFELSGGEELYEEVQRVAESSGDLFQRFNLAGNRGVWHSEKGEYSTARHFFQKAKVIVHDTPAVEAQAAVSVNLGECEFLASEVEEARRNFLDASALLPKSPLAGHLRQSIAAGLGLCALHQGDLITARRLDVEVDADRSEWAFDPYCILTFKARMYDRRRKTREAVEFLAHHAKNLEGRLVTSWIKVKLEESRLWSKLDQDRAATVAEEGRATADLIGFTRRSSEFDRFLR